MSLTYHEQVSWLPLILSRTYACAARYETGDDVHIMRKANVVLVQETHTFTLHREKSTDKLVEEVWGSWTPFDKYSKRCASCPGHISYLWG